MSAYILPDSRLKDLNKGTCMVDWPLSDGTTVRIEVIPVFCANCGKPYGFVPKENTTWAFWLCEKCFEVYGPIADVYVEPDDAFWKKVQEEMMAHYGHILNQEELARLAEQGWGALAKLFKESPIKV